MDLRKKIIVEIINLIKEKHEKEFYGHLQFVAKIGLHLSKKYKTDPLVIEISCLLHDLGRRQENENENHAQASYRLVKPFLEKFQLSNQQKKLILQSILNHQGQEIPKSIEEAIVITADASSKVLYHEAFMLLCKKNNYQDRLKWGLKYLEKGFHSIVFPDFKEKVRPKYEYLKEIYSLVNQNDYI